MECFFAAVLLLGIICVILSITPKRADIPPELLKYFEDDQRPRK